MLNASRHEDLRLPFGALATELLTHHGALFTAGDLHPTLLASAAIPGIFPPVEINGILYVDGALTAYIPMDAPIPKPGHMCGDPHFHDKIPIRTLTNLLEA